MLYGQLRKHHGGPSHCSEAHDAIKRQTSDQLGAGPHAKPELTNRNATPGAWTLADPEDQDADGVSN